MKNTKKNTTTAPRMYVIPVDANLSATDPIGSLEYNMTTGRIPMYSGGRKVSRPAPV